MDGRAGQRAPAPGDAAGPSAGPHRADPRDELADSRDQQADLRDELADSRDQQADSRDELADSRDKQADSRDELANSREDTADEREAELTRRELEADLRERKLDKLSRIFGVTAEDMEERALEAIERSRSLLALSAESLDRQQAAVTRTRQGKARQQSEIDREAARSRRDMTAEPADLAGTIERAKALRRSAIAAITLYAQTEEEVARVHEELAVTRPERREHLQLQAELARTTARRARDIVREFTD